MSLKMPECESPTNKDTSAWHANSHAISFNKSASQSFLVFHTHFVSLMILLELRMFINIYNMYNAWLSWDSQCFDCLWSPSLRPFKLPTPKKPTGQCAHMAYCPGSSLPKFGPTLWLGIFKLVTFQRVYIFTWSLICFLWNSLCSFWRFDNIYITTATTTTSLWQADEL